MLDLIFGAVRTLNLIVVAGILITAFALIIYIALYNRRSQIGRGFAVLLACLIVAFLFDLLSQVSMGRSDIWNQLQWIGIALIPAAVLDLSDTLLRATADVSPTRKLAARAAYVLGAIVIGLVGFTDLIAKPGIQDNLPHLNPGPLFNLFALLYFGCGTWSMYNVIEARRRSLTTTTRRRMTYFVLAFIAPMLGVFPYLLPTGWPSNIPSFVAWLIILLVNMGVGAAITFMGYTVAYFGAGTPDRVIKRRLVKYLIRGPLLAALVIAAFTISSHVEHLLGLSGSYVGLIGSAAIVLLTQLYIATFQPTLDRLIAGEDSAEVARLQRFSDRLMTSSDRAQYLENILAAMCDLLRSRNAFVMQILHEAQTREPPIFITVGQVNLENQGEAQVSVRNVFSRTDTNAQPTDAQTRLFAHARLWNGYWLLPLISESGAHVIGVIGLISRAGEPELTREESEGITLLLTQAARTIDDGIKQDRAFDALDSMLPDASEMTRRLSSVRNAGAPTLADFELKLQGEDDLTHLVRDALSQYWGGPKLSDSPLQNLQVVAKAVQENNGNTTKAVRQVLARAIERLKPSGQRSFTAAEWMFYNILELKVMQGEKVRDVASKLFMSESELYRKQRNALEEVARVVKEMEREAVLEETQAPAASATEDSGSHVPQPQA